MIDLHLHTTASDGRLSPAELVDRAAQAGLTVLAVTDHDTVRAVDETMALAAERGIRVVPGTEITAVDAGRDVRFGWRAALRAPALPQRGAVPLAICAPG